MGCDYYHESVRTDINDVQLSSQDGKIEFKFKVWKNGKIVSRDRVSIDVPVGGKVYLDKIKSDNVEER
jgi:hypothetical protein